MGDATRLSRVSLKGSIALIRGRARADDMHDSRLFLQSDEFFQQQTTALFIAYGSLVEPQLGDNRRFKPREYHPLSKMSPLKHQAFGVVRQLA
jgi:hypothetical protein